MQKEKLWTRDYSLLMLSTVLSAIGGEAIVFPMSLLAFDETQSTLLSAIVLILSFAPDIFFGLLIAPLVERWPKKRTVITLDLLSLGLYLALGLFLQFQRFSYAGMLLFTLLTSCLSIVYNLAYQAWLPDIIPPGLEQKGNAVGSAIYPFITMFMAPISGWYYSRFGIADLFLAVSLLLFFSILLEAGIRHSGMPGSLEAEEPQAVSTLREYAKTLREGFHYFLGEKGLRNIGFYQGITNGVSAGITQMTQYYFQTQPLLGVVLLGTLTTAQMLGRVLGGMLQYRFLIPRQRRFPFTCLVYTIYDICDMVLLYLPYPLMLAVKFLTGGLGISTVIIRSTAYQNYIPREMRARAAAINHFLFSLWMVIFQLLSGLFGERLPYRLVNLGLGVFGLSAVFLLIIARSQENRPVYEAERSETAASAQI